MVFGENSGPRIGSFDEVAHVLHGLLEVGQLVAIVSESVRWVGTELTHVKQKHHVHLLLLSTDVLQGIFTSGVANFTNSHSVVLGGDFSEHFLVELVDSWARLMVHLAWLVLHIWEDNWSIREGLHLGIHTSCINSEAVNTLFEPEGQGRVVDGFSGVFVLPVEVWLGLSKEVQVVLVGELVVLPGTAGEVGAPVVRRMSLSVRVVLGGLPDVPVSLWVGLGGSGLLEPLVGRRSVVDDQVQDQLHAAGVDLGNQLVHVLESSVLGVDIFVVANVVAHVVLRRVVHWGEPDHVDAERLDVVQSGDDTWNVADTISVGVLVRSRPDLVDGGVFPPGVGNSHFFIDLQVEQRDEFDDET